MITPEGKTPVATITALAYDTPGDVLLMSKMYPIIAPAELPMISGALRLVFSASTAMAMVVTKAMAYGRMERSWA